MSFSELLNTWREREGTDKTAMHMIIVIINLNSIVQIILKTTMLPFAHQNVNEETENLSSVITSIELDTTDVSPIVPSWNTSFDLNNTTKYLHKKLAKFILFSSSFKFDQ